MAPMHSHGASGRWATAFGLLAVATMPVADGLGGGMASDPPSAPEGSAPAPRCPADAYQDAPIVFACEGSGVGEVKTRVLLSEFRERLDFGVPKGVTDLTVTFSSLHVDGDMVIYDPVAGVWVKDHLGIVKYGHSSGTYKGMTLAFEATDGSPTEEKAVFTGAFPTALRLGLKSYSFSASEWLFGYSFGPVQGDCVPSALAGCRKYDAVAAREAATQWSRWAIGSIGPAVTEAWSRLAAQFAEDIDQVPWHRWCDVWALWPAADNQAADCKAVFKFITAGGMEKGLDYVDKVAFTFAFNLAKTAKFNALCCSQVRMGYPDEASAWKAFLHTQVAVPGVSADPGPGLTETIFGLCQAPGGSQAADLKGDWTRFIEENETPGMQAQEFHSCWMTGQECPRYNYYRTQALLFGCQPETGHSTVLLPPGTSIVGDIPAGIVNLNITVQVESGGTVDMALKDATGGSEAGSYAVKASGGACNSEKLNCKFHGAELGWTGNMESVSSVEFKEPTPTSLSLEVNTGISSVSPTQVIYSYGGYESCPNQPDSDEPDVPAGCSYLDLSKAPPKACMDFSAFLQLEHENAETWIAKLKENHGVVSTAVGSGVPFHLWPSVWAEWPDKNDAGQVWQECFHWCDGNHDGLIDTDELNQCFLLSRTQEMVDGFCENLCTDYPNENAVWATWTNGANTILAGRWETLWQTEAHVGVSPEHSFRYVDKDGNGAITKKEFKACYDSGNCGHSWPLIGGILLGTGAAQGAANAAGAELTTHHHFSARVAKEAPASSPPTGTTPPPNGAPPLSGAGPAAPPGSSASSTSMPIWVLPLIVIVLICLGLLCAMAAAPFFFVKKSKRSAVSEISEELEDDAEHEAAYSNLGVIDGPENGQLNTAGVSLSGLTLGGDSPFSGVTSPFILEHPAALPSLGMANLGVPVTTVPGYQPALVQRPPRVQTAPMSMPVNRPATVQVQQGGPVPLTTFVPYPQQRGQSGGSVSRH